MIKFFADSTMDLAPELLKKHDITLVPLTISLGEKAYKDGEELTPEMIYEYVGATGALPKTSACNSETYKEYWQPALDRGDRIIHFSFSSDMSTSCQSAVAASKETKGQVSVIDTKNLSSGSGLLVLYACDLREAGATAEEIVEKVSARIPAVQASFILDKLHYLYKGGRCSGIALFAATALSLKPCIKVKSGKMIVGKKYIGKLSGVIPKYVSDILSEFNNPDYTRIFITHTKYDPALVEAVRKQLKKTPFREIIESTASGTITSHCGPNTLGILYLNDGDRAGN